MISFYFIKNIRSFFSFKEFYTKRFYKFSNLDNLKLIDLDILQELISIDSDISKIQPQITIYPNPTFENNYFPSVLNPSISILNNSGQLILLSNKDEICLKNFESGNYNVIVTINNLTFIKKIKINN